MTENKAVPKLRLTVLEFLIVIVMGLTGAVVAMGFNISSLKQQNDFLKREWKEDRRNYEKSMCSMEKLNHVYVSRLYNIPEIELSKECQELIGSE